MGKINKTSGRIINLDDQYKNNRKPYKREHVNDHCKVIEQSSVKPSLAENLNIDIKHLKLEDVQWCSINSEYGRKKLNNVFFNTIIHAFANHLPIIINPDIIRNLVINGLSSIINNNPEKYRKYFFDHDLKMEINLKRDEFSQDYDENDWTGLIKQFSECVGELTTNKKLVELTTKEYSTTSSINTIVNNISLMDTFKSYIEYNFNSMCGISEVELLGTPEDWINIKNLILCIQKCDLEWWTKHLIPIIDKFIEASNPKNDVDYKFWKDLIKHDSQSGGDTIDGNLARFVAINKDTKTELNWDKYVHLTVEDIPRDLSNVPVVWTYLDQKINLKFIGGNFGTFISKEGRLGVGQGFIIATQKSLGESAKVSEFSKQLNEINEQLKNLNMRSKEEIKQCKIEIFELDKKIQSMEEKDPNLATLKLELRQKQDVLLEHNMNHYEKRQLEEQQWEIEESLKFVQFTNTF